MRIAVFGGSGFIGTRLIGRLLSHNTNICIFDKNLSGTFPHITNIGDVRSFDDLNNQIDDKVEVFINLAAEHRDDVFPSSLYYDVNVLGAINICQVARIKSVSTIIFTSSVAVYGYAPTDTDESRIPNPFNEYGSTKLLAENIFKEWQLEDPDNRRLVIIRPTVIFGEGNRGNFYKFIRQIALRKFIMIGCGDNIKSIAYVENISAFIEHTIPGSPGIYTHNYVDKPNLSMNDLVKTVRECLGVQTKMSIKIPLWIGLLVGIFFDLLAKIFRKKFNISLIRIRKFTSNSSYISSTMPSDFLPPTSLFEGIRKTIQHEFVDDVS